MVAGVLFCLLEYVREYTSQNVPLKGSDFLNLFIFKLIESESYPHSIAFFCCLLSETNCILFKISGSLTNNGIVT